MSSQLSKVLWDAVSLVDVIHGGKRLDGGYYNIEIKKIKRHLKESGLEIIPLLNQNGFLDSAYFPKRFKRVYVEKGIPFLSSSDILKVNPTPRKFLSHSKYKDQEELFVKEGWILLSRSGTVGNIAYATKNFEGVAVSEHVIRLIPKNFEDSAFLYIYLKTNAAQKIVFGSQFGSVVPEIDPKGFDKIPVPIPPSDLKKEIAEQVKKINKLRVEVIELFQKADELLHQRLKLTPLRKLTPKYYGEGLVNFEVDLKNLNYRFDGSYHVPLISEIEKQLKKCGFEITVIGDERVSKKTILPGRFKRIYVDEEYGVPFLGGKQILQFDLSRIKHLSKTSHSKRIANELTLHENMVLITSSGTIGRVVIAPKYFDNWTASQHIIRVVSSKEMNPGYLCAYLASDYGFELILRHTFGSVVDEIYDVDVNKISIPLPPKSIMDEIGNLVLQANEKLSLAYEMEQDAIKKVEELIF